MGKYKMYFLIGDPWRCGMTLRVKRDKIMELSDWSVPLLIGREAHIPPDPFVARIFLSLVPLKLL